MQHFQVLYVYIVEDQPRMNYTKLIEDCKNGERNAQMEFYKLFYKGVFNSAYRILENREEAEEVMQETILKVFTRTELLHDNTNRMEALLRRMAINASIDICRKRRVKFVEVTPAVEKESFEDNDVIIENGISFEKVRNIIIGMPEGYKVILVLKLLEEMEYDEIAKELNVSESSARSQYSRARRKLSELLKSEMKVQA